MLIIAVILWSVILKEIHNTFNDFEHDAMVHLKFTCKIILLYIKSPKACVKRAHSTNSRAERSLLKHGLLGLQRYRIPLITRTPFASSAGEATRAAHSFSSW